MESVAKQPDFMSLSSAMFLSRMGKFSVSNALIYNMCIFKAILNRVVVGIIQDHVGEMLGMMHAALYNCLLSPPPSSSLL